MNLDTRASRAADGARATARGVDPMTQLSELKQEATMRRRTGAALTGALVAVLVVGGAWFATAHLGGAQSAPVAPPVASSSASVTTTPAVVGSRLGVAITARVPAGYYIDADDASGVNLKPVGEGPQPDLFIFGPLTQVWDPTTRKAVAAPADYAAWLRHNPGLTVLDEGHTTVLDSPIPVLTMRANASSVSSSGSPGLTLAGFAGNTDFTGVDQGEVWTEAVLTVGGKTVVVAAFGGTQVDSQGHPLVDTWIVPLLDSIRTR